MSFDVAAALDPEIAAALPDGPVGNFGSLTVDRIPAARAASSGLQMPPAPPTTVTSIVELPAGADGHRVQVRIYSPVGEGRDRPCVLWIHGGGYIFGSGLEPDMRDPRLHGWVAAYGCVVVSIDYRLAPEHPYPAALDDCYAALAWTTGAADELGIDPARIAVVGASAGGGLAAALGLLVRDRGEHAIAFLELIYPMIDDRNDTPSSWNCDGPVLHRSGNLVAWHAYLGHEPGTGDVPAYAAPARADDLRGLPPTWIGVGTLDHFRDECVEYARRLLLADVPTELHVYPGAPHGFELIAPRAAVSRNCEHDLTDALRRGLGIPEPAGSSTR
jgi:acetyl esterase/lipase